jgi:PAS domain S-box-containing protein
LKLLSNIVIAGLVLAVGQLVLLLYHDVPPADILSTLLNCTLALLMTIAAWRASRRSSGYPRMFWSCVCFVAALWTINFGAGSMALLSGTIKSPLGARWPTFVISSFPLAIALVLPLLLREGREKLEIGWLQVLDMLQFGIIVFSAFLVFLYIPSFRTLSDADRARDLTVLHLTRDSFLALGYLYRGWRSRFSDLRRLHFRMAGFLAAYGSAALLVFHALNAWHWPRPLLSFMADLPPLFLLITAVTWQQEKDPRRVGTPYGRDGLLWTQLLAAVMPLSVLALASRMTGPYLRGAWIIVTASFACYAARLFLMQRRQNQTLSSLAAMEERFSKAFKSSPIAIAITRLSNGNYIDVNDRWLELTKLAREQVIGRTSLELGVFENEEERSKLVAAIQKQGFLRSMPFSFRLQDRIIETLVSAELIKLEGEPLLISSILDVTELRSLTQQLQQSQKMEVMGKLAGGVAHDFNNLLTIIKGYSELVELRGLEGDMAREVRHIREAADKAAALTRQLLAFSRRQILQPRNIRLNAVMAEMEQMLRRTIGAKVELVTSLAPDLGILYADPVQIEQVAMNLAVNACDAMPFGGKLLFQTKNLDISVPYPERGFELPPGRYVMLVITDTGTGIEPQTLDRIFEPFFTTKEAGQGTGLGLSTVYGIVKQSGGYISVESEVGSGTTFKVYLPRAEHTADAIQPAEKGPENLSGTETVLVVEDDPRVCELAANVLANHGYTVITANSADEAVARSDQFAGSIDLLLTDIAMARVSGDELAQRLGSKRPGLKVLYMSGHPHFSLSGNIVDFREAFLAKPFSSSDLARAIRTTLNRAEAPLAVAHSLGSSK